MKKQIFAIVGISFLLTACECCDTPQVEHVSAESGITPGSLQDFVQNVGDRVFFDFDRSEINPCGHETLAKQSSWLKQYSHYTITIAGHCDERGTTAYNLALGERRAKAARDALVKSGVPAAKVQICTLGKERPVVAGHNEAAWAQNRVAITVLGGGAAVGNTDLGSPHNVASDDVAEPSAAEEEVQVIQ